MTQMALFSADYITGYLFTVVWLLAYAASVAHEWARTRFLSRPRRIAVGLLTAAAPLPGRARLVQIIPAVAVGIASLSVGAWTTVLALHAAPNPDPLIAFPIGLIAAAGLEHLVIKRADSATRTVLHWLNRAKGNRDAANDGR